MENLHKTEQELRIDYNKPLGEHDPLDKLNDLARKKRKHADDIHDCFKYTKRHDFVTIKYVRDLTNEMLYNVQEIFFRLHQGHGLDDHARTFSSLLLTEVDKRNMNPLKQIGAIEQLRHSTSALQKVKIEKEKKVAEAEAAMLKAQPSYPNIHQLIEIMVTSLKTELGTLIKGQDLSALIPAKLKVLLNKMDEVTKVEKLEGFKLTLLVDLTALPGTLTNVSSQVAKLKVLDAIPDIMNKVVASLDKFVDAISSASNRARPSSFPLIGQVVTPPAKG
ncbi:hypothetical protein Tco_0691020 [Tanacetum coccineum]